MGLGKGSRSECLGGSVAEVLPTESPLARAPVTKTVFRKKMCVHRLVNATIGEDGAWPTHWTSGQESSKTLRG